MESTTMIFDKDVEDLQRRLGQALEEARLCNESIGLLNRAGPDTQLIFEYEFSGTMQYGDYKDEHYSARICTRHNLKAATEELVEGHITQSFDKGIVLGGDWLTDRLGQDWTPDGFLQAYLEIEDENDRVYRFSSVELVSVRKETVKGL